MVKHIVMWKIKEDASGAAKKESMAKMKALLEDLPNKIDQIKQFEVGLNVQPGDAAFDIVLYSEFESIADLEQYQKHPAHQKAVEFIRTISMGRHVVDYIV